MNQQGETELPLPGHRVVHARRRGSRRLGDGRPRGASAGRLRRPAHAAAGAGEKLASLPSELRSRTSLLGVDLPDVVERDAGADDGDSAAGKVDVADQAARRTYASPS